MASSGDKAHPGRQQKTWKVFVQKRRRRRGQSNLERKKKEPELKEAREMGMQCQWLVKIKLNCTAQKTNNQRGGKIGLEREAHFVCCLLLSLWWR